MQIEPEKLIINIIKKEMNLADDYGTDADGNLIPCIAIGSQNVLLGTTDELQIIVRSIYTKTLTNRSYEVSGASGVTERKQAIYHDTIQVDMMSYNDDARVRRHELIACLKSIYAKYMCDKYCCRIYDIPDSLINTGIAAGGSAINRWTIRFKISYMCEYTNKVDYYDTFSVTAQDDTNLFVKVETDKTEQEEEG